MAYNQKRCEATEQTRVMNWARHNECRCEALAMLHHIPNGGSRNQIEAKNLKAQGVKSGVPDLCLPVPRGGFHGLYIEMKFGKNKTSANQDWWIEKLKDNGYVTAICWTAEAAMDTIAEYLKIEKVAPLGADVCAVDHVLKSTVPYYNQMKRAAAAVPREKRSRAKKKPQTLTEYSESGNKPVLKHKVTVNQAARKLYEYEQCGLSPREVLNIIERAENLERRVKKYESWD